jgi:hypothetical protein
MLCFDMNPLLSAVEEEGATAVTAGNLARCLSHSAALSRRHDAVTLFSSGVRVNAGNQKLHAMLGDVLSKAGHHRRAELSFRCARCPPACPASVGCAMSPWNATLSPCSRFRY